MILEDTRGPNPEIHKLLIEKLTVESATLGSADYAWYDIDKQSVGVERKTASDLLASLRDGRLGDPGVGSDGLAKDELVRMRSMYDHALLIVEGFLWSSSGKVNTSTSIGRYLYFSKGGAATIALNSRHTQFRTSALIAALYSYTRYLGIETYFVGNTEMAAELLIRGYLSDQELAHGVPKATRRYQMERLTERQRLYSTIPGIGPVLAQKLDKELGSVVNLTKASKNSLVAVLGAKRGERVYEWLRS